LFLFTDYHGLLFYFFGHRRVGCAHQTDSAQRYRIDYIVFAQRRQDAKGLIAMVALARRAYFIFVLAQRRRDAKG
jgi:hypothetical protein